MVEVEVAKLDLRRTLRERRRRLVRNDAGELAERSAAIAERLVELAPVDSARVVAVYRAVPGEVDVGHLAAWCAARAIALVAPEPRADAEVPDRLAAADVVVVPSLAVTTRGERLGQGGGWYDRALANLGADACTVAPVFREFVEPALPVADHDIRVDCVVTDDATWWTT